MHRRVQTRLFAAIGIALVAALAACGSDGDANTAEKTPRATASQAPLIVPTDAPSANAGAKGDADSPYTSGAVPKSVAQGYTLVWSDEFDGTSLGADWKHRLKAQPPARACSALTEDMVKVSGGSVSISVTRDPSKPGKTDACPDGHFLNGMIGTDDAQAFKHGIMAARIKFHRDQGAHGAFWLQPLSEPGYDPSDPVKRGVEIDVIEYFGKGWVNGGLSHFIHFQPPEQKRIRLGGYIQAASDALDGELPSDDYHVFSVEWTPTEYIFRVQGKETFRTNKAVSGTRQYLILSLLSSSYETPKITDDVLPLTMSVDWVRVWQE